MKISSTAHVIFPFHKLLDGIEEKCKKEYAAGTTGRGIGPTYSDKAARFGIRVWDLLHPDIFLRILSGFPINTTLKQVSCYFHNNGP